MVTVFNKSNRPIGIAGQSVLPDREIRLKDKDVFCAVFDEDGNDTGKKMIIPGLSILEKKNMVTIKVEEQDKPKAKAETSPAEEVSGEEENKTTAKRRYTKKTAE